MISPMALESLLEGVQNQDALKNKNNEEKDFNGKLETGEEEEEGNNGDNDNSNDINRQRSHLLEIFETQKALHRMLSQFAEEIINNSEIFNIDGPEDLTTTKDERESSTTTISELINNGQQQQQNWSYEDQFKQVKD
uniref:Uncharacterized protein n=1 Tax=Meloidogyne javanica TaxID=6303 RepID=A0A915ND26_MELJA